MPAPPPLRSRRWEPAALTALVLLAAAYHWSQAQGRATPWIFPDELRYAEAARAVAETGSPAVRGELDLTSAVHAYLTAAAWLWGDVATGWQVLQAINAAAFASAAVPVYLIARRVADPTVALLAALGTVLLSAGFYASTDMTEPLALPLTLWVVLAAVRLAAGGGRRWLVVLVTGCVLGAGVREQLVALPVAAGLTLLLGGGPSGLRGARALASVALLVAVAAGGVAAAGLDATRDVLDALWTRPEVAVSSALESAGSAAVSVWVVPAVAYGACLAWLARTPDRDRRALAGALAGFGLVMVVYVGAKAATFGGLTEDPEERNLIYLEPLALAALAAGAGRAGRLAAGLAAAAVAGVTLSLDLGRLSTSPILSENPGASWLWHAALGSGGLAAWVRPLTLALCVVGAMALVAPRAVARWSLVPVAAALAWTGSLAYRGDHAFSEQVAARWLPADRSWVDRRVDGGAGLVATSEAADPTGVWSVLFWNRSIRALAEIDALLGLAPGTRGAGPDGRVDLGGATFAVSSPATIMRGRPVVLEARGPFRLTRLASPARLVARLGGRLPDGWAGDEVRVVRYGDGPAGDVTVPISARSPVVDAPRTVSVLTIDQATGASAGEAGWRERRLRVAPGTESVVRVPVAPGPVTVALRMYPLTVPARIGVGPDPRALSLQFGPVTVPGLPEPL